MIAICFSLVALLLGGAVLYARNKPRKISVAKVKVSGGKEKKRDRLYSRGLFVHVAGAVKKPDVYELDEGSRVIDAIKLAGGPVAEADLDALNLAAKLSDGQKIYVPTLGEIAQNQTSFSASQGTVVGEPTQVSLNTATQDQLEELPGIGPTLAQRIIDWRTAHNGFSEVDQLKEVEGIGPKKFESIKDKVSIN